MGGDAVNSEFPVKNTKSMGILLSFVVLWNSVGFDIVIYNVFFIVALCTLDKNEIEQFEEF